MKNTITTGAYNVQFLDATAYLDAEEVLLLTGLSSQELAELADLGVLQANNDGRYTAQIVDIGRRAVSLRDTFELDLAGLALALGLLARIDALEARLQELSCQLPR